MEPIAKNKDEVDALIGGDVQFKNFWAEIPNGPRIAVLINRDIGWLMYLRHSDGDSGFSTRNPASSRDLSYVDYRLHNGQGDEYPKSWTYPVETLRAALHEFFDTNQLPCCVSWHDDSLRNET